MPLCVDFFGDSRVI